METRIGSFREMISCSLCGDTHLISGVAEFAPPPEGASTEPLPTRLLHTMAVVCPTEGTAAEVGVGLDATQGEAVKRVVLEWVGSIPSLANGDPE